MKVGVMLPNYARWFRGPGIWDTCLKAKELELDALCFVDHIIFTRNQYVGFGNGYMDIWTAMSYVAAITNAQDYRPILTQAVVDIPYRPPVQQAKIAATIDSLSDGRLMVGAGAGYVEEEFRALGLDVRKRGEMTHEYLACMKELWSNPVASFHGKYANFDDMTISVQPAQYPHPPIIYGSHGSIPRKRIAELYQGSIGGPGRTPESREAFEHDMKDLDRLWKENDRTGKPFWMSTMMAHLTTDRSEAGGSVMRGLIPEGREGAHSSSDRLAEGEERVYASNYNIMHVDDVIEDVHRMEALGIDMVIFWLPSYSYNGLTNAELQLQQMDVLAEHVFPKINRDKDQIEMDFAGTAVKVFEA